MQKQEAENNYEMLIEETCGVLGLPYQALKEKYKDYPICLMEYIDGLTMKKILRYILIKRRQQ